MLRRSFKLPANAEGIRLMAQEFCNSLELVEALWKPVQKHVN